MAEPISFRGITLYPVQIRRSSQNGPSIPSSANFEATFVEGVSASPTGPARLSAELARMVSRSVLNGEDLDLETIAPVGRILIVVEDNLQFVEILQPYIQWKQQQGYRVTVAHPSDNTNPYIIKQLIESEYWSDNPYPLEYVLVVGDHDANSNIRMVGYRYDNSYSGNETDNWYACMEGRLPIPDVAIGRFSVRDTNELRIAVNKTLIYERDGELEDASWLRKSALTAGSSSGISVLETNRAIHWMFDRHDFEVDSLWWTMPGGGGIPQFIHNEIDLGVGFVNYRGYYGMSGWNNGYLEGLNNVGKLPIVVTITCGTGMWGVQNEAISEGFFRAGTVNSPVGAVACIGTGTTDTHTRFNNVIDAGVFEGLLINNVRSLGWCLVNGKLRLGEAYGSTSDSAWIIRFVNWNNLIGDPALRMWLNEPVTPVVDHQATLNPGSNFVDVDVTLPGEWPELVWATLASEDRVIDSRLLNSGGRVRLNIDELDLDDTITLTVVGDDVIPYQAELPILIDGESVAVSDVIVHDGNDDIPNAGETLTLDLELHNFSDSQIPAGLATVNSIDPRVESIASSTFNYPAIPANQTVVVVSAVSLTLAGWAPDGCVPAVTAIFPGNVRSAIPFEVFAWELTSQNTYAWTDSTSDRRIFPGETGEVAFQVKNHGRQSALNLSASMYFEDDSYTVLNNPISFSDVDNDSLRDNLELPFLVELDEDVLIGEMAPFVVRFEDDRGGVDSVFATLIAADPRVAGATGPDTVAGYWAVDDTDIELIRPEFEWVDNVQPINNTGMSDNWSGGAYNYNEEDASVLINLPFPFIYYGQVYDEITINTNGWISMGNSSDMILFRNWPIPNPLGPPAMIAPYWDDLHTGDSGVYASYDIQNDQFVVTWDCIAASDESPQVFQVILYGPTVSPTASGNGRILFQYLDVSPVVGNPTDNDYVTIGIESPDQTTGVEYQYWNFLRTGAEPVSDGRAILITDDLNSVAQFSEGSVTPIEASATLTGVEEVEVPIYIENTGEENLIWVLDSSEGPVPDQDFNTHQGRESVPGQKNGSVISAISPKDSWGYYWKDSSEPGAGFEWLNPPDQTVFTEDDLRLGSLNDGYFRGVKMPFQFEFYGSYYDSVYVAVNGFLVFQGDLILQYGTEQNRIMPSTWAPRRDDPAAMAAVWWDDLDLENGGEISIWTGEQDSVLVTWSDMSTHNQLGNPYTFQALLLKNGFIKLQYLDMDEDYLLSSTIGIQNHNAEHGLLINLQEPFMEDQLSLLIAYDSDWIEPENDFGILEPGEVDTATVRVYSDNLNIDSYEGHIIVRMNDADDPIWYIPLTVDVTGTGSIPVISGEEDIHVPFGYDIDPVSLDQYVEDETWGAERIRWTVTGNDELRVNVFERTLYVEKPNLFWQGSETVILTATNPEGNSDETSISISVGDVSVDESNTGLPQEFSVGSLYPNPFNPSVSIDVALPTASAITIEVFDVLGRSVERLSLPVHSPGYHSFSWDGSGKPSGVYFFHVQVAGESEVRKAVLMK
ncbi:Gingipain R1 precursor [bacterium BMS3Bbin04]|nr:Gingipain R1 precursor [bacterium BMS3Bbin04]